MKDKFIKKLKKYEFLSLLKGEKIEFKNHKLEVKIL